MWLESEYSLYVLMQATKRIYRVGQTNDVEIHFPVYQDSMEHRATALAGQKWAAAQLLYGDSVEGALTQAVDTGSFLAELTKSMIAKARVVDLSTLFRQSQVLSRVSVPAQKQTQRVHPEQGRRTPALLPPPTAIPIVLPTGALVQLSMF